MDKYKPPFVISDQMLNSVSLISEKLALLEVHNTLNTKPHLRRNNRIKSIYSSCKIEANSLNIDEVKSLIDGKTVIGPQKEIQEVKNAYEAYEKLSSYNPYSQNDLKKAHKIICKNLINNNGQYRKNEEGVFDGDKCIFMAPPAKMVDSLMGQLFDWLKENKNIIHPLILSSAFHFEFIFIHPFSDGNGRTVRLWQSVILSKWKKIFEYIPIESQIERFQEDYYNNILICEQSGDISRFIEFMLVKIEESIDLLLKENKSKTNNDCVNKLLNIMEYGREYSSVELMSLLNLKSRNGFRNNYIRPALINKLIELKYNEKPTSKNQKYFKI